MASFGAGSNLWRVDVVVRRGNVGDHGEAICDLLRTRLAVQPDLPDEAVLAAVEATNSYDMDAPEGTIGVSCWVRADTVGGAVQTGHDVVVAACREVTGQELPLWDVRVLPRAAVLDRPSEGHEGQVLRRYPS